MIIDKKREVEKSDLSQYPNELKLDIILQRKMTTYLHRSLPMCIILSNENYKGWYYTNFVQIMSNTLDNGDVELNYITPRDGYIEIAENVCLGYPMLQYEDEFVSYVIKCLNRGYYLVVHIDEFYIPDKWAYEETHFVHASLIYGYNQEKRELYGIGFDEDMTFREITFDFDMFNDAYESGKKNYKEDAFWCEWSAVQLIKPKSPNVPFRFDLKRFVDELDDYMTSRRDEYKLYSFDYPMDRMRCGVCVYDQVIEKLEELKTGVVHIDYRAIHLIAEHKKGLLERFEYIKEFYNVSDSYEFLLTKYVEFVDFVNKFRLDFMTEFPMTDWDFQITEEKIEFIDHSIEVIQKMVVAEQGILKEIMKELRGLEG